ncbi:MAG: hypothetical protein A3F24_02300 [Candidatus Colwellbacteria bacterium RIFCSPHIGHO2_12_FULL_44_17]|uniref:HD domain-containing protein n=2 Tax=Candidatus Colwelliibacteriota TaxID=1817904 RepID=A0A1G1Z7F9_9BACT|nr:MAG: hypothetical protein A3F24_02300 [Candidatus Colwellbacteria bacterium RIFCSPHIGHO2_12_FULL_44_17]OGY60571.1 MAG: hypothetical protein A3I31_02505 [Candidatus Colwellbacteria bacterium RIFCSPLOWO2_02_FULL_44_20b]
MKVEIPQEIKSILKTLGKEGFETYIVGGCVRDLLLKRKPKDWDVATNAKPPEIQKLFPESIYENTFGTVGVKTGAEDATLAIVEVTTLRREEKYSDYRHPDVIEFTNTIEEDLARRDFTVNAIALDKDGNYIDPWNGEKDLKDKIIRAVRDPEGRFQEDALRLMRAIRFAVQLNFEIEPKTESAIKKQAGLLRVIAKERIRDEFIKIILASDGGSARGIYMLEKLGLLEYIVKELREGIGIGQNKHHIYTVFEHNVRALDYAAQNDYSLEIRLASLLHDVGKPRTKAGDGPDSTFYNHEVVGGRMTYDILNRLRFPKRVIEYVTHLVRYHLFYYNVGEVSEAGVRRFISRVGTECIEDLLKVREADRIGSGVPKAVPYKLRHLKFMIEKVKTDPISPKMIKINGNDLMKLLNIEPGPKVGKILAVLLEEILDNPKKNEKEWLEEQAKELNKRTEAELETMAEAAKKRKEEFESGVEEEMKKKYYVK